MGLGFVLKDASPACPTMRGQLDLLLNGDTRQTLEKIQGLAGHHFTDKLNRRNQAQDRADRFRGRSMRVTATLHAELAHLAYVLPRTDNHVFSSFGPQDDRLFWALSLLSKRLLKRTIQPR